MALMELKSVTVAFEGHAAVENVCLKLERGEYTVMLGRNGSGKSTLMRAMLGLVRPKSGQILVGDGLRRDHIGYMPQKTQAQRDFPAAVEEVLFPWPFCRPLPLPWPLPWPRPQPSMSWS